MAEWINADNEGGGYWTGLFDLDIFKNWEMVTKYQTSAGYPYTLIELEKDVVFFVNHKYDSYGFISSNNLIDSKYLTLEETLEKITSPEIRTVLLFHLDLFT